MSVEDAVGAIRRMGVRGAAEIARTAAETLKDEAEDFQGRNLEELRHSLALAKEELLASRPTAISLWNSVQAVLKDASSAKTVDELRQSVTRNADDFIKRSREAVETIGRIGSRRLRDGDKVLTHCNSKAALSVLIQAHKEGKVLDVYATESRPWRQGLQTVKDLTAAGMKPTLIVDSAVRWLMKDLDAVVVGADTICSNGALINKIGTSQIALAAHEARVPFMVCAETFKFSPKTMYGELVEIEERDSNEVAKVGEVPAGTKILNPVFDATPPEYIDAIVTEIGVVPPSAAYEIIVRQLGHEFIFEADSKW